MPGTIYSAPGKVILFGEHAVVYGQVRIFTNCAIKGILKRGSQPALATAIDLRCYVLVKERQDGFLRLCLSQGAFEQQWCIQDLFQSCQFSCSKGKRANEHAGLKANSDVPDTVDEDLCQVIHAHIQDKRPHIVLAITAFLYSFLLTANSDSQGYDFTFRETLPCGAGLGSSAAYNVCTASALLYTFHHLVRPSTEIPEQHHDLIERWSLLGEKHFHGNPSGVDNCVATRGRAVLFKRNPLDNTSVKTVVQKFAIYPTMLFVELTNPAASILPGFSSRTRW